MGPADKTNLPADLQERKKPAAGRDQNRLVPLATHRLRRRWVLSFLVGEENGLPVGVLAWPFCGAQLNGRQRVNVALTSLETHG